MYVHVGVPLLHIIRNTTVLESPSEATKTKIHKVSKIVIGIFPLCVCFFFNETLVVFGI